MADNLPLDRDRLERTIVARHAVRLHLTLILLACFATGLVATKLLLVAGVDSMLVRYPVALVAAYAMFLLGIRLWLVYAGYGGDRTPSGGAKLKGQGADWIGDLPGFGTSSPRVDGGGVRGGGGGFGGAGASAEFAGAPAGGDAPVRATGLLPSFGGKGSGSIDPGDDGWVIVALVALAAAVLGVGIYLVYMAPTILSDATFAALLSGGLVRSTRRIGAGGWVGSVIRDTWIPFAVVFAFTLIFAATAHHFHPEARTAHELLRRL
jgi:hypothetical protein